MAKAPAPHKLYWKSQLVGVITEVTFSDFPWVVGRFEARRLGKPLRGVLDWFAVEANELQDPPFAPGLLEGWSVVSPDGGRHELLMPPLVDFNKGMVEWR